MTQSNQPLIFELSKSGRTGCSLPDLDIETQPLDDLLPRSYQRKEPAELPEVSELQAVRHFTALSQRNHGVDTGFYPLGSCTMKYNPKVHEDIARFKGFAHIHPYQDSATIQGALEVMYRLQISLAEITGMAEVTLQPAAGAHGEWTGLMLIRAFHEANQDYKRNKVIVPDSAHGTNPASAVVAGFEAVTVRTNDRGLVDLDHLKELTGEDTAALMLTNPNTLGLFEEEIVEMAEIIHEAGGKLYYDGANSNAILGIARPGDMGFDVVHLNLHKTFTTPHGGGGPGSGPVGVKQDLVPYLPAPQIIKQADRYVFHYDIPESIGRVKPYYGNFGINVRAYAYIRTMGPAGLRKVSEFAVLNANYMLRRLEPYFDVPYSQHCKHEFVLSGKRQKKQGVRTLDMAKRLLDFGYHPPTIYFPINVEETMMIEPTETEAKEVLDEFCDAMIQIAEEAEDHPEIVQEAPHHTVIDRLDETKAARQPVLRYEKQ
ncbi:aminomethyl-transferring glycine dehydrogenase subunit GcvPB [Salisediminibacterium halotolerans]|uniref:aminomethyl-transferring glycine dehydrogenase subunit GcvPB n=1 Tax=Salisediminibacterium halotolerans TaxID=517425 RepID=UPI000EB55494|nr:aminomethyl-transferring glycine dehydrogenase subunit GcvPB [Salisediminibacterium halotolerans]RLJ78089.1 glycine dehydrogenase (decarboxylating) beta subunit [Actinophytocola xinjiangensis]RPE88573.1 glycine dehydrogenase (decarboxylating) beta subunit [Salisediminibacterium halotolerans]TWG37066.1 glycine dehydrogenase (decarboxylating) beta subunit [Salisediminibacterium halotolerans]GEL06920.1 putative glycine dehydrogenase (decarboxylating) subunit 2 [Salisediminibacterium halotoleran